MEGQEYKHLLDYMSEKKGQEEQQIWILLDMTIKNVD
jgi:hypothetical protein